MDGHIFRWNLDGLIFACHLSEGSTLKEKNLLLKEQILSFKSRPHFERVSLPRKGNWKSKSYLPFNKNDVKNMVAYLYTPTKCIIV